VNEHQMSNADRTGKYSPFFQPAFGTKCTVGYLSLSTPGEHNRYGAKMTNGGQVFNYSDLWTHTYSDFCTKPTTLIYPFPKQWKVALALQLPWRTV